MSEKISKYQKKISNLKTISSYDENKIYKCPLKNAEMLIFCHFFFVLFIIMNNKNMILILFNIFLLNYINTVYHVHELIMVYELQTKTVNTTHLFMRTIYKMYIEPFSMILTKYIHFLMTVYTTHIHVLVNSNEYTFS